MSPEISFFLGIVITLIYSGVMSKQRTQYLQAKGDSARRTPAKIGDAFYYVVPEDEYNRITQFDRPAEE